MTTRTGDGDDPEGGDGGDPMISENLSEKPKRGRPRLMEPGHEQLLRNLWPAATRRSIQNKYYVGVGMRVMRDADGNRTDDPAFEWLRNEKRVRFTIL